MVFTVAEMKTSFAALAVTILCALPLFEKFVQRHVPRSEHTQVAVQGHDPFIFLQRQGGANGNGFLANAAEPFGDAALPQQHQHFFFDQPGPQKISVDMN